MDKKNWDYAKILTKDELISYLGEECWLQAPTERNIKSWKWDKETTKLTKAIDEYLDDDSGRILAKELDELVRKFSQEKDSDKKIRLGEEISKKHSLLIKHNNKFKDFQKKQNEIDKLVDLK